MVHYLQAFVARRDLLDGGPRPTSESTLVDLRQGFGMLIEPEYDDRETELDSAVETFGVECSRNGPVAYVATAYHGGIGGQAAIAWEGGGVLLPYETEESRPVSRAARAIRRIKKMLLPHAPKKISPISAALKAIGVVRGDAFDEFAAVGLGECRNHEDWVHFSRTGRHRWQMASGMMGLVLSSSCQRKLASHRALPAGKVVTAPWRDRERQSRRMPLQGMPAFAGMTGLS